MSARQLLETEPCPCQTGKPYVECCLGARKEGYTSENSLHMLFEEKDSDASDALTFYAIQTMRMDGSVPAATIVENISKRIWSPPMQRALDKLTWQATNSMGLKMTMTLPPDTQTIDVPGAKKIELYDSEGKPVSR